MIQTSSPSTGEQDGIHRLASIVWEHRTAATLCLLASTALCGIGYATAPIRYKSEAVLALDVRKLQALPTESVVSPFPQESPVLRTELDIINSRVMAERVLASLRQKAPAEEVYRKTGRAPGEVQPGPTDQDFDKTIDDMLRNVRVINDGRSYTIYISYYATDPVYAAAVANAFGEAYISYQIELQTSATRRVSDWLGERLVNLRTKLEESEREATEFREKSGLVETGGSTLQAQQLSGLNAELTALQARLATARARLATALEAQEKGDGLGLTEVLSSPSIQALRTEQARVMRAIADIDQSGARMNPLLPQLTSQLASLNNQVGLEITQIVASLRNEIASTEKERQQVRDNLKDAQQAMSATSMAIVQSGQLDREASANRSIYETYLARYKQTIEQDGIASAEARIISRAMPSQTPTSPDKKLWGLIALLLASMSAIGMAVLLNFTSKKIPSIAALGRKTGLSVIGRIPRIPLSQIGTGPEMFSGRAADFHHAIADLQAYLRLMGDRARVVAFTSSRDGEGKTFIVANLARSLALSGVKLVLVDANLRSPGLDRQFAINTSAHLRRAVMKEISFDEVIHHDRLSGVDLIVAHPDNTPPDFILGDKRFASLIAEMRQRYELVIIDAPTASHDLDLMRIAGLCDSVTFVVKQDSADGTILHNAISKLRVAGKHVSGLVLNGVRRGPVPRSSTPKSWLFGRKRKPAAQPVFRGSPAVTPRTTR